MGYQSELLELIDGLLTVAQNPEDSYTQRMQLKRVILSASRLACAERGIPVPDRLQTVKAMEAADQADCIFNTCRRLAIQSEVLCQPSEAFGARWKDQWDEVAKSLRRLKRQLQTEVIT